MEAVNFVFTNHQQSFVFETTNNEKNWNYCKIKTEKVIGFATYGQLRVGPRRFSTKPNFPSPFIFTSKFFEMQEVDQSKLQVGGFVFILNAPIIAFQRNLTFPTFINQS